MVKSFGVFFIWLLAIVYLSFTPLNDWPQPNIFQKLYIDKVVHFTMYSVLSFLLLRGIFLRQMKQMPRYQILLITFIFCTGVGVVIEFLQPVLTAYRKFEWLDMVANATGALGGIVIFRWLFSRSRFGLK